MCPSCSGGGGVFVPSLLWSVHPRCNLSCCGHSRGFVPPGQLCQSGGVGALWRLDPPPTPCQDPCGFSASPETSRLSPSTPPLGDLWATLEALHPLLLPCTPEVSLAGFYRLTPEFPLCAGLAPWRPRAPNFLAAAEGDFPVSPLPVIASPCGRSAPLSSVTFSIAVCIALSNPVPPCSHCLLLRHRSLRFL